MRIFALSLVIFGSFSCVFMETCPPAEDVHPCICEEEDESGDIFVTCSDESLNLVSLKNVLNGLSGKENVDMMLGDFELGTVPSNFFYGVGIKRLEISHCELDTLSDDGRPALSGLENTLEELEIVASFTEDKVPAKLQFGHLVKLRELDLSYNTITEIGDDWFERGPASLEYLTISNNGVEKIGRNAFANLINLKELALHGNRFGPIYRSLFPKTGDRLEVLELDNNALTGIPEDIFQSMPSLSTISLRTNGLSRLDKRTWYPVWEQLDVIRLEGNPIHCDGHMNWIFELRKTSAIYGKCHSPKEFEGQSLQDMIDSRSRYRN